MADLLELYGLDNDSPLRNKITSAMVIKAQQVLEHGNIDAVKGNGNEGSTAASAVELAWCRDALNSPKSKIDSVMRWVLAANEAVAANAITTADDGPIETQVNLAVEKMAGL
jgi:hypothetical protein